MILFAFDEFIELIVTVLAPNISMNPYILDNLDARALTTDEEVLMGNELSMLLSNFVFPRLGFENEIRVNPPLTREHFWNVEERPLG